MQGRLTELRKAAGYKSAKDFAVALGMPATTYSRYEACPEKIPLRVAWLLADRFGVTIDQVVGRDKEAHGDPRGDVQRTFDALELRSKEEAHDFLAWLADRDARRAEDITLRAQTRWEAIAMRVDRAYLARLTEETSALLVNSTDEELRDGFEELARSWVVGAEHPLNPFAPEVVDETALGEVMAAYDRTHGSFEMADGMRISWSRENTGAGRED